MGKSIVLYSWAIVLAILAIGVIILLAKVAINIIRDPQMKWYKRLKWHIKEINKTLSNEPSHYSSKRLERLVLFLSANVMLNVITYSLLHQGKISAAEAVLIYGAQMVYAGYQTNQIRKDVTKDEQPKP